MFAGHAEVSMSARDGVEKTKPIYQKWLEIVPEDEKEVLEDLLMRLFPKLKAVFKNTFYGSEYLSEWRKELRISSPKIFPIYFRLALPEGQISNDEMKSILELASDNELFSQKLKHLSLQLRPDGSSKLSEVLERFQDYTEKEIPIEQIPCILQSLYNIGDDLVLDSDKGKGEFGFGNNIRIGQIMFQLIRRFESQEERYQLLKEAFSKGNATSLIVSEVEIFGQQQGKHGSKGHPESEWFINPEQLADLEKIALQKIKKSAAEGELLNKSGAVQILFRWSEWGNPEEMKQHIAEIISSDEGLADFLSIFLSKVTSWAQDDKVPRYTWRLEPKSIEVFVENLTEINDRCGKILESKPSWLIDKRKTAVETYLKASDWISKGKSIDDFEDE